MSRKNRTKVHVCVTIYCQSLSIQMALLLFSEAESKSYAVAPMMLFSLKYFSAPIWGIPFIFVLPPCSKLLSLCTSEKDSEWYFKSQILTGKLFWERLAPMVDALWALEMWWAPWQLPELHMVASLSPPQACHRWLTSNCGLLRYGVNWPSFPLQVVSTCMKSL